ncbi:STAS/SEC14 domain-containing protein [Marinobacter halodurans]|uniref:STAS/SEC14 domain-containing protein n=1 Tax=Marinobacter halodurans TaxID=2528979 RepID=A0ABY1ZJ14_9GAMM|nr:STAS/SEC14 domain-containing protein [Marinobacter halodurans]TBW51253.1 STAS/SEC14 domain-containing protein [Marinobacter halodurans]
MLKVTLDRDGGIAILEPDRALTREDFQYAANVIDPYIEAHDALKGLLVHVDTFPGWASFASMLHHLRFIRDHHRHIRRVALVTDSGVVNAAETLGSHLVAAAIRTFPADAMGEARRWLLAPDSGA